MLECYAVTRLTWQRIRIASTLVIAIMVTGIAIAITFRLVYPQAAIFFVIVGFLPAAIWSLLVFDTDLQNSVEGIETGYDPWLLRMPIATWKLAIIPASMRAAMVGGTWVLYAVVLSYILDTEMPKTIPAIVFATAAVWLAGATWRPFSRVLTRSIAGVSLFVVVNSWAFLLIWADLEAARFANAGHFWRIGLLGIAIMVLLAGFWFAERCLVLARHQPDGRVSASARRSKWNLWCEEWFSRPIANKVLIAEPKRALAWHDWFSIPIGTKILIGCFGMALLGFVIWVPLKAGVMLTVLFGLVFCLSQLSLVVCNPQKDGRVLPPYLVASPLRDREFAWWRAGSIVRMFGWSIVATILISLIWLVRGTRLGLWQAWSTEMATHYETDRAALRIIVSLAVVVLVATLGRSLTGLWSAMLGRPRVHLYAMILSMSWILAPIFVFPVWMLKQTDYESAIANAWWWAGWLPWVGWSWLLVKSLGVMAASVLVVRSGLATFAQVFQLVIGWIAIVSVSFAVLVFLNPEPMIRPTWIGLALAFLLPLARVVILPYSVHLDRHR
ncbi:hypothetical protein Pla100_30850 [Neorhodopirellula pilleata]|uniref:Uncharacterized protein n=2 Tax=Neorhodopirellula pilleata TaxID=2714738 RepID=A0A5C6A6B7_9BACT|nr:hypothetical protein Pla100_30850 [Neorhodopirellula pilleata]